jgi:D-lactate dehydrogenase
MKIAVFETAEWEEEACRLLAPEHVVACTPDRLTAETAGAFAEAEAVSVFVHSEVGAAALDRLPALSLVATRSSGTDHIDLDACRRRGITVSNVPDYGDSTVAEHVFALLLALARHLPEIVEQTRRGDFATTSKRGFELSGKVLGVVGTGRIGRRVIEIARGFAMEVVAFDIARDAAAARRLGFRYVDWPTLLRTADVVSLHVPATAATAQLIGDKELHQMKPGAILINTARGNVIDVEAMLRALHDGRISAAGLDVLPDEPLIRDEAQIFRGWRPDEARLRSLLAHHALLRLPNVIVTPHIAYNTGDAVRRILATTLENIRASARGEPQNVVEAPAERNRAGA